MEQSTAPEPELILQPREKVLWESDGGPARFDTIAWAFSLFWTLVFTVLSAVLIALLIEQIGISGFSGLTLLILAGLLILGTILVTLARHMYSDYTSDTEMNYAITNQRLVVANKSGTHHTSYTGRPFSSLEIDHKSDVHNITLKGIGEDKNEVVVQLLGVKDGADAEKLLLKSFMQTSSGKS